MKEQFIDILETLKTWGAVTVILPIVITIVNIFMTIIGVFDTEAFLRLLDIMWVKYYITGEPLDKIFAWRIHIGIIIICYFIIKIEKHS
jgi:hypothetical protein